MSYIAASSGNSGICNLLGAENKEICLKASKLDVFECEMLQSCLAKNECKAIIAYVNKDVAICDNMVKCEYFNIKYQCYWWISQQTKDSALCNQIPSESIMKDWCLETSQ